MASRTERQRLSRDLRWRGVLILGLFGFVWALAATSGLPSGAATVVGIGGATISGLTVGLALQARRDPGAQRLRTLPDGWYRSVGLVNGVQGLAIVVAVIALVALGAPQFVMPAVCLIVGVHFVPLRRLFDQPQYYWTGVALVVVAGAGLAAAGTDAAFARAVVGVGAALALYATSLHVAVRG